MCAVFDMAAAAAVEVQSDRAPQESEPEAGWYSDAEAMLMSPRHPALMGSKRVWPPLIDNYMAKTSSSRVSSEGAVNTSSATTATAVTAFKSDD